MNEFDFDVAVIGGGSGGYAAARAAAGAGLETVVIEGGKEVGGLCILRGCMPSKALLYAADVIHLARHAETWGIRAKNVGFDFALVMARKNAMINDFADDRVQQLTSGKFKFIRATAWVTDPHTVPLRTGREGGRKAVSFERDGKTETVSADEVLFALGRTPSTMPLHLEKAGVKTERDRIVTNARMQTSAPHIYAAGDCTGPYEIVHIAIQQGEIAAHNIAHPDQPRSVEYRLLTHVVFTDPQIGTVGLTEKEAKAKNVPYLAASYPFSDHGKSLIMDATDGFVKLLANPATGEIIGGCCVGPVGGELIHEIIVAMARRMTIHRLGRNPHLLPSA